MKDFAICDPFAANCCSIIESFDTEKEAEDWLLKQVLNDPDGYVGCIVMPKSEALNEYGPATQEASDKDRAVRGEAK